MKKAKIEMTLSYDEYKNLANTNKQLLTACESALRWFNTHQFAKQCCGHACGHEMIQLEEAIRTAKGEK